MVLGVINGKATKPDGPHAVALTPINIAYAPPNPAPNPAVMNGLPNGKVTP